MRMIKFVLPALLFSVSMISQAQTNFRSNGTGGGTWNSAATWQVESPDGSNNWISASSTPTAASGSIEVRSGDIVTITSVNVLNLDQATIDAGGTIDVLNNTLSLANVANAMVVNGTLSASGTGIINSPSASALVINNTYTHNRDAGAIPTATWVSGSNCNVTGVVYSSPTGLNPTSGFYNFTWNCPNQYPPVYAGGNLVLVSNDLIVANTGGAIFGLVSSSAPTGPISIGHNLQVTGNSRFLITTSATSVVVNVGNDFTYNSTSASGSILKYDGSYSLNVSGNFSMNTSNSLSFSNQMNSATVNLNGNFTLTAGTLTSTGASCAINFNKNGVQTFTNNTGATISPTCSIDYNVASTATVDMIGDSYVGGNGGFTLNGTLKLGSTNSTGALMTGTSYGNIRNSGARNYNSGSKVIYAGTAAQIIGNGHPMVSGVVTEIANSSGVSFTASATGNQSATNLLIQDNLVLTNGTLSVNSSGSTRSLTLNGSVSFTGGSITFAGTTSDFAITGTTAMSVPFSNGAQAIRNLTLNKTGTATFNSSPVTISGSVTLTSGTLVLGGTTSILGNVSLASGTVLAFDGQSLSMSGNYTSSGGLLSGSGASALSLTGTTALTSSLDFLPTNNSLQSLTLNKTNSGTSAVVSSTLNVTNLNLTRGVLSIVGSSLNISSGGTISRNSASSIATSAPTGAPWNLVYSGTAGISPGLEMPASGSLTSLSSSNSNIIALGQSLTVGSGGITINAGTFNSGANTISTSTLSINAGTFTAPSSTLTVTSNFSIIGTYSNNSGTLIFGGNTQVSGAAASTTNFNNVTINGTLTPSATINIQGNFVNNGSLVAGSGTVNFSGSNVQTISGSSNTQFFNLQVNRSTLNSVTVNSAQTVTNNLTLSNGTLNVSAQLSLSSASGQLLLTQGTLANNSNLLTLASGSTIARAAGSISTSSPAGGPWNLIYTGTTKTTGLEIPSSGNLSSLSINVNSGSNVSLAASQPLNVTGLMTVATGTTFFSGNNNVSLGSLTNGGTFSAPSNLASTGLTLNGLFTNNGTFNNNSGTVVIGGNVSISGTIPVFSSLTVNSNGVFNAPLAVTFQGNMQNNGSFVAGTGTVTFAGNTAKQITGTSRIVFNNVNVTNGSAATDLSLETIAGADLKGVLTMSASAVFDTDGSANDKVFTLLSTADKPTNDASVAALPSSGQLPGKITVQRYLSRIGASQYSYQVYRDISSPVNTTVSDLQNSLPVTGPFANASVVSGANSSYSSMEGYDETVITDANGDGFVDFNDGFIDFPTATGNSQTSSFTRGVGYSMFIYGSDPPVSTSGKESWSLRGPIWNGTFNLPVTFTSSGDISNDGWNLVGNPYPSTIDWNSAGWTKTNMDNAIYIDDYNPAQPVVASYVNGVSTNGGSNLIGIGQGFWVKANAASPVLTIQESVKAAGSQTTIFRVKAPSEPDMLRISLIKGDFKDETVIYFSELSTSGYDPKYDALKFMNHKGQPNLSSMTEGKERYAINAMPPIKERREVPLSITSVADGSYQLNFSGVSSLSPETRVRLKDNFSNALIDIRQTPQYTFVVDTKNMRTFGSSRFTLVLGGSDEAPSFNEMVKIYPIPVKEILTVEVPGDEAKGQILNILGADVGDLNFEGKDQTQVAQYSFAKESNGVYFVKIVSKGRVTVTRIIKE